jgi:hypothetical protein
MTAISRNERADDALTPERPITARMTPPQWAGVVGAILVAAGLFYTNLYRMEAAIAEAQRDAHSAAADATKALDRAGEVKAELQAALMALSAKLGRIEGLLETINTRGIGGNGGHP